MPCYLVHGFRWPRRSIRVHIIMENIDDAAAEYVVERGTSAALLANFTQKWPGEMAWLPRLRFVEQYDPLDTSARALSQPHAFVVDTAKHFDLSLNVQDAMAEFAQARDDRQARALDALRALLAPDETVGWWVVYNGDEDRCVEGAHDGGAAGGGGGGGGEEPGPPLERALESDGVEREPGAQLDQQARQKKGLKRLFKIAS